MTVDEIARRLDVPRNYLSKILHALARTEILDSTRGPGGGFRLGMTAEEISLSDVARHFDTLPDPTTCFLGRDRCSDADPCQAHHRWVAVRDTVGDFLSNTRLSDVAEPQDAPSGGPEMRDDDTKT